MTSATRSANMGSQTERKRNTLKLGLASALSFAIIGLSQGPSHALSCSIKTSTFTVRATSGDATGKYLISTSQCDSGVATGGGIQYEAGARDERTLRMSSWPNNETSWTCYGGVNNQSNNVAVTFRCHVQCCWD